MKPQEAQSLFSDLDERLEYSKSHPGFIEWTKHGINDPDAVADARAEWEAFEKWRDEDDKNRFFLNRREKWSPYSRDPFLRLRIWKQNMADLDKYVNEINPDSKYLWRKGDPASFRGLDGKWYDQDGKSYSSYSSLIDSRKQPNLPWLNKTAAFRKPHAIMDFRGLLKLAGVEKRRTNMTRYEKGFIEKCAEHGVDGSRLLSKSARFSGKGFQIGDLGVGYMHGYGGSTVGIGSRNGGLGLTASVSDTGINNALLGAGAGAAIGLTRELLRDPEKRKHYLRSILIGLAGGGAIGLGATMVGNLPDYTKKIGNLVRGGN